MNEGERHLLDYMHDIGGSFHKALLTAMFAADNTNLSRLKLGFPEEVVAVYRYQHEAGYWEKLQNEWRNYANK